MTRRSVFTRIATSGALGALIAALAGCQLTGSGARSREQAEQRWRIARADVKARLAADQLDAGNINQAATELSKARRLAPDDAGLKILESRVLLADGRFAQAERLLESGTTSSARGAEARYLLGIIEQQRLHWDSALEHYLAAADQDPDQIDYVVAAVQVLLQLSRADDGLELLAGCKDRVGWQTAWHAARAECFEQLERWEQAAGSWRRVANTDQRSDISERLALALYRSQAWRDAIPILQQIVDADQSTAARPVRLALAECLLESGDAEGARGQALAVLGKSPRNVPALRLLARILAADGHYERGLAVIEQALEIDPNDMLTVEYAAVLAFKTGDTRRAARWARVINTADSSNPSAIATHILERCPASQVGE